MKTVYRVEHPLDGWGMFRVDRSIFDIQKDNNIAELGYMYDRHYGFHSPSNDGLFISAQGKKWYCAYKSRESLKHWITGKEREILLENGYRIYKICVGEYREGECQIIYTKESIISKEDISEETRDFRLKGKRYEIEIISNE